MTNPPFFQNTLPLTLVKKCCFKPRQGLATSEDGLHWQRACNGQPVMSPGGVGDFDALFVVSWRQIRWIFRGHMEVDVESGTMIDVNMMFQNIWNTGCGDV